MTESPGVAPEGRNRGRKRGGRRKWRRIACCRSSAGRCVEWHACAARARVCGLVGRRRWLRCLLRSPVSSRNGSTRQIRQNPSAIRVPTSHPNIAPLLRSPNRLVGRRIRNSQSKLFCIVASDVRFSQICFANHLSFTTFNMFLSNPFSRAD